jgi:hypothetical protein
MGSGLPKAVKKGTPSKGLEAFGRFIGFISLICCIG